MPEALQEAIARRELTGTQLPELITHEVKALRLDYAQAVALIKERRLPKDLICADLELLAA